MKVVSFARTSRAVSSGTAAPAKRIGRAWVSMLRIWLVKISPAIGRLAGRTTLVGNGRTRDVIGQTIARPVF
jgi:hypothetical protein